MVFIALIKLSHKQFIDIARELITEKVDMIFHTRHHIYARTKKKTRVIARVRQRERRERIRLDLFPSFTIEIMHWEGCL